MEQSFSNNDSEPKIDFTYQYNLIKERVEKKVFSLICNIAKGMQESRSRIGILVVVGHFRPTTTGMKQMTSQNIDKYLNVLYSISESEVMSLLTTGGDGAIIVNYGGEILGAGVYLMVNQPSFAIPEGAGTRHISAVSFSKRDDVISTFTLSEETNIVRSWRDGLLGDKFDPAEEEDL